MVNGHERLIESSSGVELLIAFDSKLQSLNQNYEVLQEGGPGVTAYPGP
jgi:hypothetical protein